MTANPRRTFHYHANAHVLSGQFTRPLQHLVEVQGASSLPTIGGHGKGRVDDFRFEHFLFVKHGYTHVSGSEQEKDKKKYHTTLVTSVAEGVNLMDVVTVDRIIGRFASSYSFDDNSSEPDFTFIGSKFENLQVAGCDLKVCLNVPFFEKIPTFGDARKTFKSDPKLGKIAKDALELDFDYEDQEQHGAILHTIVDVAKLETAVQTLRESCPGVTRKGHCLVIPKFGKLFLGEILLQHGRRTLTMLRFELGSPVSGSGTVVQLDSNGSPIPPTKK